MLRRVWQGITHLKASMQKFSRSPTDIRATASLAMLAGAVALLFSVSAHAQSKTDGQWRASGGAGLSATSGNSNTTNFTLTAEGERATLADRIAFGANVNYGRSKANGVRSTTANKWSSFGQYDYNLSQRVYSFGKLNLEGDELVDLSLRASLAGGLGYKLIDTDTTRFSVFGGAAYSRDKYSAQKTINGQTTTRFSRTSILVGEESSHALSTNTTFKQRLDVYSGVSGDKAKIAKFTAGLAVAMTRTLSLTVDLVDNYNSRPAAGFKSNDVALFTGISVKLGAP